MTEQKSLKDEHKTRIYIHYKKLYIRFWTDYSTYLNSYDGAEWEIFEEEALVFGFELKLFDFENMFYDEHVFKSITILGLKFGYMYSYALQPLKC